MESIRRKITVEKENGEIETFDGFIPSLDSDEVSELDTTGFCVACGETQYGVEPDGREYECETCGDPTSVYGIEELIIMDLVDITG